MTDLPDHWRRQWRVGSKFHFRVTENWRPLPGAKNDAYVSDLGRTAVRYPQKTVVHNPRKGVALKVPAGSYILTTYLSPPVYNGVEHYLHVSGLVDWPHSSVLYLHHAVALAFSIKVGGAAALVREWVAQKLGRGAAGSRSRLVVHHRNGKRGDNRLCNLEVAVSRSRPAMPGRWGCVAN